MRTCSKVERTTTLTVSNIPLAASRISESRKAPRQPEADHRHAEHRHIGEQGSAHATKRWAMRQDERHQHRARRRRRAEKAESLRSDVEDLSRKDRKERGRPAEQHREEIECERAENHRLATDEADTAGQTLDDRLVGRGARLRRVGDAGDRHQTEDHERDIDDVCGGRVAEPVHETAECRTENRRELPGRAAPRDGVGIQRSGHELGAERGARGLEKAARDAAREDHDVNRPHAAGMKNAGSNGEEEQRRRTDRERSKRGADEARRLMRSAR